MTQCKYLDDMGHCLAGFLRFCDSKDPSQECIELLLKKKNGTLEKIEGIKK